MKIMISSIPNCLNYYVIFIVYVYIIYRSGHGLRNTFWQAMGWRSVLWDFVSRPVSQNTKIKMHQF